MSYEIEIKAWVDSFASMQKILAKRYIFERSFEKQDLYYQIFLQDGTKRQCRIRKDEGKIYLTGKQKSWVNSYESNEEAEFPIDSFEKAEEFLKLMGFSFLFSKIKKGIAFSHKGVLLELHHVTSLGNFLEIEKIVEREQDKSLAIQEIQEILATLEIPKDKIETRSYQQLLREKK